MSIKSWIRKIVLDVTSAEIGMLQRSVAEQDIRIRSLTDLERTLKQEQERLTLLLDVIDERIEKGNKIWRAIRARERREELRDEGEEDEQPGFDFRPGDADRSEQEGVQAMYGDMGYPGEPLAPHQRVAKDLARQIAFGGFGSG